MIKFLYKLFGQRCTKIRINDPTTGHQGANEYQ